MISFILRNKLLYSVLFFLLWGGSFYATILDLDETAAEILIWTLRILIFIFWLPVLIDMFRSKIKNRVFWILSMFLLPFFVAVVYIFRRKNLVHLKQNRFKSDNKTA
ncbi:hypothetical protein E0K83_11810 [Gramella sp. BOM4]|nr:hypothetical protein [Christiangramia bathymodioli]